MKNSAITAKAVRQALKEKFPNTKFSVKSSSFAGGDDVHVRYMDGMPERVVSDIVDEFQYGSFNAMIDLYEYTNYRHDIPQVKWTFTEREISTEFASEILKLIQSENYSSIPKDLKVEGIGSEWHITQSGSPYPESYLICRYIHNYSSYFSFDGTNAELYSTRKPRLEFQMSSIN